jgi:translation initiation factor IF-2
MRVHELAKKLGVKTQDLIERLRDLGLEAKSSPLAGLDEGTVERIERAYRGDAGASAPPAPRPAAPSSPPIARPVEASRPATPAAPSPPPEAAAPRPSPAPAAPTPAASAPSAAPSERPASPTPAPARPAAPTPPAAPTGPLSGFRTNPRPAGPLAGHTPHRGAFTGGPSGSGSTAGSRPSGPLQRSDYISPTGTRGAAPSDRRPINLPSQTRPPVGEGPRRDQTSGPRPGGNRPLPGVAAPPPSTAPVATRPAAPRPSAPIPGALKPEKKFTVEEYRRMMSAGGAAPGRPGAPGLAARLPGAGGTRLPMGPAAGVEAPRPMGPSAGDDDDRKGGARKGAPGERDRGRPGLKKKTSDRGAAYASTSAIPVEVIMNEDERPGGRRFTPSRGGGRRGGRRGGGGAAVITPRKTAAIIEPPITVRALSEAIGVKANQIIRKLWDAMGPGATINSVLDDELAMEIALDLGVELTVSAQADAEQELLDSFVEGDQDEAARELRPPVITVLGHVDHGKTSLLDRIRKTNVVAGESGGITQHIGAYQIEHEGKRITFVDTPGHEAFTAMRARGANVTDIVVLVVAADDGVMPQTAEAIAHAKAAEVPVVVALNKIDLPNAESQQNITKIFGELAQHGLNPTEWGGETDVIRTSTVTGRGIDDLLTTLELMAEAAELKANPNRPATGTCLESSISEGRGVVATVLVQDGTLRVGDVLVCGESFGRVRALYDDQGRPVESAPPSMPVEVSGLDSVPPAGDSFHVVDDISRAREIAESRRQRGRGATLAERAPITLENIFSKMAEQKVKTLNLILKADVQGSLEALTKELEKLKNDEVPVRVLLKGVGGITESDVSLAEASDAIVIGFRVAPEDRAIAAADEKKIDIRRYDIIYQVTDEIKKAVEGLLVPEVKEVFLGKANVRQVFKISKVGTVAGCFVTHGIIERGAKARIIRDGREIYKGTVDALKRFKDDVREVRENFECGIKISNFDDIKVDDTIEAYRVDVIRRTL